MSYSTLPHLRSNAASQAQTAAPTKAAGAAAGTSPTIAVTGSDESGVVSITAGTSPATGTLVTLTFQKPYAVAPTAFVVENDSQATQLGVYCTVSTTALTIKCRTAGTQSDVYLINYLLVGGA